MPPTLTRRLLITALALAVIGLAGFWLVTIPGTVPASVLTPYTANLVNGKTVFYAGGCESCHATPGQADRTRLGGGLALKSPFGTFYPPNISPDPVDGIGRWSEQDFVTALWRGTSPDGRHYYPAFPYSTYQRMRLEDARDLFAYMRTLPAVQGRAPDHAVPFPFNVRRGIGLWKLLFVDGQPFRPDPARPSSWNRGAYLVEALGHCAECHSPRNAFGGIRTSRRFTGGRNLEGEGRVPNITQHSLGNWSESDFANFLATGDTPEGDSIGSNMRPVIRSVAQLSPDDRAAMAAYLKTLPAR